jgi:arsenite methyltransferase
VVDIVAVAPLPARVLEDLALHTGCVAGAMQVETLSRILRSAGFTSEEIDIGAHSSARMDAWSPALGFERFVAAAN